MEQLEYKDKDYEIKYRLIRTKRKTIGISVDTDGVKVHAPRWVSHAQINSIVAQKAHWIMSKLEQLEKSRERVMKITLENGSLVPYLGRECILLYKEAFPPNRLPRCTGPDEKGQVTLELPRGLCPEKVRPAAVRALEEWYREACRKKAEEKIHTYSLQMGVSPNKIVIKNQKRIWGSCTSKGTINLNWKIILAPEEVMDYLIVHEMSHLKEMNHSQRFWKHVEKYCPDYRILRKWLKVNGNSLELDWENK